MQSLRRRERYDKEKHKVQTEERCLACGHRCHSVEQAVAKWESEVVSSTTGSNANIPTDNRRKLTDDDIAYIIERLAAGDTQQAIADSLADKVKVDLSQVQASGDRLRGQERTSLHEVRQTHGQGQDGLRGGVAHGKATD